MLFETPSATCAVLHRCDLAQITILFLRHDSALFVPFAKPQRCYCVASDVHWCREREGEGEGEGDITL